MKETAIVIGASAGLGRSLAQHLAQNGHNLILSARSEKDLNAIVEDLKIRFGIEATALAVDLSKIDAENCYDYVKRCQQISSAIGQVYITSGIIDEGDCGEASIRFSRKIFDTNFFGVTYLFSAFASVLQQTAVNITVISSVAAIRPRAKNLAYASSKLAVENFVLGLKHHYKASKLNIQLYRMGYMDTGMTRGKKLPFPMAAPLKVATYLYKHRNSHFQIRYYPGFWKYIAGVLSVLPWSLYKKLHF